MDRISDFLSEDDTGDFVLVGGVGVVYRRLLCISCDEGEESKLRYYQFDLDDPRLHEFFLVRIYTAFDDNDI